MTNNDPIYLDYAASTPLDPAVLAAMLPWLETPGNAHARHHAYGGRSARAVETARAQVAAAIGAQTGNVTFTSGATEANNLVLRGLAAQLKVQGKTHIVTGMVEHASVLAPLQALEEDGFAVTRIPPKPCGMIEAAMIALALRDDTGLVSIQAVNNELGTVQPLAEIAAVLKDRDILLHADGAQALGKLAVDVAAWGVDFLSLSAHKVYGPQGIGALYVRSTVPAPLLLGGGQEKGLRAGTVPTALCVGMGEACALIRDERAAWQEMRTYLLQKLAHLSPVVQGHSDPDWQVPGILNLRFDGIDNETLVMALPGLAFGTGSACAAQRDAPSHVIAAIASEKAARESIRLSWGRFTTIDDIERAAAQISAAVTDIKTMQEVA